MEPKETAQEGLNQLKKAVVDLLKSHPEGMTNAEIADALGIRSDHNERNRDYLSFSVLGLLMKSKTVVKKKKKGTRRPTYKLSNLSLR